MSKDVINFISDSKNLTAIAKDIAARIEKFKQLVDEEKDHGSFGAIDYNFNLKKGKQAEGDRQFNTDISVDLDKESKSYEFMKLLYSQELTDEEEKQVSAYVQLICERITDNHGDLIRGFIRKAVLHDAAKASVPLSTIKILAMDIIDFSATDEEDRYLLRFHKMPGYEVNLQNVQSKIMEIRDDEPNATVKQIVERERRAGNPVFQGILDVNKAEKYLWELNIKLYVDYSFSDEFIEQQNQKVAQ